MVGSMFPLRDSASRLCGLLLTRARRNWPRRLSLGVGFQLHTRIQRIEITFKVRIEPVEEIRPLLAI